jgi:surfeit locus 1 family protein
VGLGFWQLDRAEQKRAIQAEYDARSQDAPVGIGPRLQDADMLRFHRMTTKGSYDPDYQVLIDNRVQAGQVGYYVITPLRIPGSDMRVLVNRGWVPLGASREDLPKIETPTERVTIDGVATVPSEDVFQLARPRLPVNGRSFGNTWI